MKSEHGLFWIVMDSMNAEPPDFHNWLSKRMFSFFRIYMLRYLRRKGNNVFNILPNYSQKT